MSEKRGTLRKVAEGHEDHGADESFRLLVDSVRDYAIFMLDPTGHVMTWNLGAERTKGYTADEIIGRHFSTFYLPEDASTGICDAELADAQKYGRMETEGWRVRRDGSRFWAAVVITALYDDDGNLRGFAKVTRDITERRIVTESLLEHERLLAETQRLARLGSWEWDIDSDRVTWSDEMFRIFGIDLDGFVPTYEAYLERLDPDDRIVVEELVRRCVESGDPYVFDHRVTRPDGEVRWVQARGRAVRDGRRHIVRLQGSALDVTDQRHAADAREQVAAMALRQRHALEVNDDIIQGLAVADLALNLEDYDKARESIAETFWPPAASSPTSWAKAAKSFTSRQATCAGGHTGPEAEAPPPVRVVVADNDSDALDLLVTDLRLEGHDIVGTAPTGDGALELCATLAPDALVVDFRMPPGMNGVEAARRIRERQPDLRIVLYTNYVNAAVARGARAAGAMLIEKGNLRALRRALVSAPDA